MAEIDVTQLTLRGRVTVACPYCGKPCVVMVGLEVPKRIDAFQEAFGSRQLPKGKEPPEITEKLQIVECYGTDASFPPFEMPRGCNRRFVVYLGSGQVTAKVEVHTSKIQAELDSVSPLSP